MTTVIEIEVVDQCDTMTRCHRYNLMFIIAEECYVTKSRAPPLCSAGKTTTSGPNTFKFSLWREYRHEAACISTLLILLQTTLNSSLKPANQLQLACNSNIYWTRPTA